MFYKQTIKTKTVIDRVETAVEALNVSVNEFGYVNLAYMLSIYEPDITNAKEELAEKSGQTVDEITFSDDALAELRRAVLVEELDGLIFLNPDRYNGTILISAGRQQTISFRQCERQAPCSKGYGS